jgi:hypothetical protein
MAPEEHQTPSEAFRRQPKTIYAQIKSQSIPWREIPALKAKASKRIQLSTGGFSLTAFWRSFHDFLPEGWGYVVELTWIN